MSFAGLLIELLVAGLLAVTIGYCALLNKRLQKMRADEETMRSIIVELVKSTETAERAILGLRATASECNKTISARLTEAREVAAFLDQGVASGRHLAQRHAAQNQMRAARPAGVPPHASRPAPHQPPQRPQQNPQAQEHDEMQRISQLLRQQQRQQQASEFPAQQAVNDQHPARPQPEMRLQAHPQMQAPTHASAHAQPPALGTIGDDLKESLHQIALRNRTGTAA